MENIKISDNWTELVVNKFDNNKHLEIEIFEKNGEDYLKNIYINPNQVNKLINHLAESLKEIKEPIELISTQNDLLEALQNIKTMCDGNITNENNIWHIANKAIEKALK